MQPTTEIGMNHSGMQVAPDGANKMLENTAAHQAAARRRARPRQGARWSTRRRPTQSARMPDPELTGIEAMLMDKLGERLAFERAGTRLYDALMVKCRDAKTDRSR